MSGQKAPSHPRPGLMVVAPASNHRSLGFLSKDPYPSWHNPDYGVLSSGLGQMLRTHRTCLRLAGSPNRRRRASVASVESALWLSRNITTSDVVHGRPDAKSFPAGGPWRREHVISPSHLLTSDADLKGIPISDPGSLPSIIMHYVVVKQRCGHDLNILMQLLPLQLSSRS